MAEKPDDADVDWNGVTEKMAREIKSQAEVFLQAQLQTAIASDQRATTMASVCVTLATAVIAAGIAYWDKSGTVPILVAAFASAATLLTAAGFAAWSARPVDFYFPGNQPKQWYEIRKSNFVTALGGEAENYDRHIRSNGEIISENQRAVHTAFWFALASPVVGGAVWGVAEAIFLLCQIQTA